MHVKCVKTTQNGIFYGNFEIILHWVYCQECIWDEVIFLGYLQDFLRNMWGCLCRTGPLKFRWSRGYIYNTSYHHHQIGSINLSHCCHIFPRLCAWGGCTIICCRFHICIYIYSGTAWFCFFYYCAVLWCVQIIKYIMAWWSNSFAHYVTSSSSSSSLCRCIWRYWTYKMFVSYILLIVCLRLSQFSQLSFIQYMGLCVFSLPIYLMMIVRIYVLYLIIVIKSEVWPICHCLGLGHETKVCLSIFLLYQQWNSKTIIKPNKIKHNLSD